jgi:hypothetical protein
MFRQPFGEEAEDQGVIDGENAFQDNQQENHADIGGVQVLAEDVDGGQGERVNERHQMQLFGGILMGGTPTALRGRGSIKRSFFTPTQSRGRATQRMKTSPFYRRVLWLIA